MVKHQILLKLKKDPVLAVSLVLAVVSAFLVRPSAAYLGYIDWRVLALLAALMLAVAALGQAGLFDAVTAALLRRMRDTRRLAAVLVGVCFFAAMLMTNDVALITFVPLTLMLTAQTGTERFNIPIIALQTVAANLGSAMTPLGNPQNLYLYSLSGMGLGEFLRLMAPVTGLSLVLLSAAVLCLPCRPLGAADIRLNRPDRRGLLLWGAVFAVCLLSVLRVLHYGIALGAAVLAALLADRRLLRRVDYSLLLTFLFFFVFVGNMINENCHLSSKVEIMVSICLIESSISAVSATFFQNFSSFWAGLGSCFRSFMDYSYPSPACYQPMAMYIMLI